MEKIFKNIFWDVDINIIDPKKHQNYVIERILEYGNQEQVAWMMSFYDKNKIVEVLKSSCRLSDRSANFWANYFNLSLEEIKCLPRHFQKTPKVLWPY